MASDPSRFACPKCGHRVTFPIVVRQAWHRCNRLSLRSTELVVDDQEVAR
jgi:hypothetical protein